MDNFLGREGFETAWGLSIYVSTSSLKLMFDAGPSRGILIRNAKRAGISLEEVEYLLLSHPHGDHVGGISAFYPLAHKPKVIVPKGFSPRDLEYLRSLGFDLEEVEELEIGEVKVVDSLGRWMPELVCLLPGGIMLTGCSHNGISRIVEEVLRRGEEVKAIIGGLHLFSSPPFKVKREVEKLIDLGVEKIAPMHCSGRGVIRYLEREHPEMLLILGSGSEVTF